MNYILLTNKLNVENWPVTLTSAACCMRTDTVWWWPCTAARWRAVSPALSTIVRWMDSCISTICLTVSKSWMMVKIKIKMNITIELQGFPHRIIIPPWTAIRNKRVPIYRTLNPIISWLLQNHLCTTHIYMNAAKCIRSCSLCQRNHLSMVNVTTLIFAFYRAH